MRKLCPGLVVCCFASLVFGDVSIRGRAEPGEKVTLTPAGPADKVKPYRGQPRDNEWAELREAQLMANQMKNTPVAVAIDIGDSNDIHPRNKKDGGTPGEVIVRITANSVEVLAFAVEWDGPHTPVTTGVPVATVNLAESNLVAAVSAAIEKARATRLATYRPCARCDETNPPEWMHDAQTCQRCAERHLGVVY